MPRTLAPLALAFLLLASAGCAGMSHADNGALIGSGIGAATGAIIGDHSGNAGTGAIIGAATGALAGGLMGEAEDAREERDAALAYAHGVQQARAALTNADIVNLSQSGVSDAVILGSVRANGGRFDLSPQGLISLKQHGVSDGLIRSLQQQPVHPAGHVVVEPAPVLVPPPVVVRPRPTIIFSHHHHLGHGRRWRHRHWRHRH